MDRTKFLTVLVLALLVLNLGTLGYLFLRKDNGSEPQLRGPGGPSAFIIKTLEFTPEQEQQFVVMRDEHRKQMMSLSDSLKNIRDVYFNGLKTSTPDTALANERAVQIAQLQAQMHQVTFNHFIEVRKLCNPHQQELFDKFINEILHAMQPPGPGNGRPQGRRP